MRRYELMLLFRPDLEDDKLQSAVEKVTRAIVNAGGTLTKVSPWGKRRLAYDIQHFREASYFLLHFDIAPSAIREIERGMLISEEILRHLVTVLEDRGAADEELAPAAMPANAEGTDAALADDRAAPAAAPTVAAGGETGDAESADIEAEEDSDSEADAAAQREVATEPEIAAGIDQAEPEIPAAEADEAEADEAEADEAEAARA